MLVKTVDKEKETIVTNHLNVSHYLDYNHYK